MDSSAIFVASDGATAKRDSPHHGEPSSNVSDVEMDEESQSTQKLRFAKNEKIFAKDGKGNKYYYPATVKLVKQQGGRIKVHYSGWNERWDQWLTEDLILRDTEKNRRYLEASKLLGNQQGKEEEEETNNVTTTKTSKRKREEDRGPGRKRRGPAVSVKTVYEDFCELPLTLKTVLLDEMEKITRSDPYDCSSVRAPTRAVHQLPAPVTIQQVLKHFSKKRIQQINSATATTSSAEDTKAPSKAVSNSSMLPTDVNLTAQDVEEFCDRLTELFEIALPKFLLYPQEQPQYEKLVESMVQVDDAKKKLTEIFGCEYLLRLYVRLPVLMQAESVGNIKLVGPLLAELLVLLQKNRSACFKASYREPLPEEWLDIEKRNFNQRNMDVSDL